MTGVEHILLGIDHLLFVGALLLLVPNWRQLVATVTAFTVAHSLTLAGATLGVANPPTALTEVLIALSIAVVAAEVVRRHRGLTSLTTRRPWSVAFVFGLLHGFGFAGALDAVGLPSEAIVTALLFFNLGVEAGQLLFIGALVAVAKSLALLCSYRASWVRPGLAYGIGIAAAFWTAERTVALWT